MFFRHARVKHIVQFSIFARSTWQWGCVDVKQKKQLPGGMWLRWTELSAGCHCGMVRSGVPYFTAECSHITSLLFKLRQSAPSPLSLCALIFNSVAAKGAGASCMGDFSRAPLKQEKIISVVLNSYSNHKVSFIDQNIIIDGQSLL